ncbi:hypothetical protein ANCDUO_16624 [Ancylostoma duodenale]|uniref:Endonuclease/exonuclease/phosphatase domain-containing protein n=1 Tax=Ancylostoma duodenale TaxID=51022 RepID=A0A0C2G2X4_9BILA|nr:hypothetical protein ANCDUO_16624 [Ancylostoma duodenale]
MPDWEFQIPEPQDRIDFIFFKGGVSPDSGNIFPVESFLYSGAEPLKPIPDHIYNDYPSDHFALITEFHYMSSSGCQPCS